jgi:hypothetical protein
LRIELLTVSLDQRCKDIDTTEEKKERGKEIESRITPLYHNVYEKFMSIFRKVVFLT